MLTLKEPIKLQTAAGQIAVRDDFGDRIRDNYSLLSVQFTPKELLLLMSTPPEEQEEQPGMTTLVTQNKVSMYQGVSLEIVNHIVNRILLTQHTPFTYQDTVYISTMLRKAGVTDVSLFMRQIRQLTQQSEQVNRLTALYQLYQNRLPAAARTDRQTRQVAGQTAQTADAASAPERYFLHSEIFRRLQTAAIYREVGALLTSTTARIDSVTSREMRIAEHFRTSSQLRLAELRQRTVDRDRPMTLQHLSNHYERGDLLPAPENEEQVFSRLAEAVLYNTVEKSLAIALHRGMGGSAFTLDLRQALQQSIDNTVFRFENWYAAAPSHGGMTLRHDERQTTQLLQESNLLEQIIHHGGHGAVGSTLPGGGRVSQLPQQALSLTLLQQAGEEQIEEITEQQSEQTERRRTVEQNKALLRNTREMLERMQQTRSTYQTDHTVQRQTVEQSEREVQSERQVELTQRQTEQTELTTLREQLDEIDRLNRERLERAQQVRAQETVRERIEAPRPDAERVITDALRAIDHPEQVIQEMLTRPEPEKPRLQLSPDARALLSQADEPTRRMLEAVMQYEANPEAGLPVQVHTSSLAAFNAAVAQEERPEPAELVLAEQPDAVSKQMLHEAAQEVTRHAAPQATRYTAHRAVEPTPLHFVHKTEQRSVDEELIEKLEQQRQTVQQTEQTKVTEQREHIEMQQIEQTQRRTIERTSEDVTELINRTLARQLGTISDKVYSQMEKRLRMERARRGR
ncbi:MAG TPA: hypothetical protein H9832_09815 [Candidatus Agathobaculum merdavium]|nr:hypothetical protein [Candidatus Agathobaculum merdavium]